MTMGSYKGLARLTARSQTVLGRDTAGAHGVLRHGQATWEHRTWRPASAKETAPSLLRQSGVVRSRRWPRSFAPPRYSRSSRSASSSGCPRTSAATKGL